MKFKTLVRPALDWLWQVAPWLIDRVTGKPRSPEEMREQLKDAKKEADKDVREAFDKKFPK
jgi:hypothetical protein